MISKLHKQINKTVFVIITGLLVSQGVSANQIWLPNGMEHLRSAYFDQKTVDVVFNRQTQEINDEFTSALPFGFLHLHSAYYAPESVTIDLHNQVASTVNESIPSGFRHLKAVYFDFVGHNKIAGTGNTKGEGSGKHC